MRPHRNSTDSKSPLSLFVGDIERMRDVIITHFSESAKGEDELLVFDRLHHELIEISDAMKENYIMFEAYITGFLNRNDRPLKRGGILELVEELKSSVNEMYEQISNTSSIDFIFSGIRSKIYENLLHNYQITSLEELQGHREISPFAKISDIGSFRFDTENIEFGIDTSGLQQLQEYSKVIYLESPIHWKLKKALENIRNNPRFFHFERDRLSGVPGYFYDLASVLREQYPGDVEFPGLFENLTSKGVLGGKIIMSEAGELFFRESARDFPLILTATGVVNLGMLALLIERKVLDKGTFLFIDEPEAHLHPAWQVVMAETLFALAQQGVNVVIATHSVDILKWIEEKTEEDSTTKDLVALNHFSTEGVINGDKDFDSKLDEILQELTDPFTKMFLGGV